MEDQSAQLALTPMQLASPALPILSANFPIFISQKPKSQLGQLKNSGEGKAQCQLATRGTVYLEVIEIFRTLLELLNQVLCCTLTTQQWGDRGRRLSNSRHP